MIDLSDGKDILKKNDFPVNLILAFHVVSTERQLKRSPPMMKTSENMDWDIILKKIKGRISASEEEILENWLKVDPEHRKYYNAAVHFYMKDISDFDLDLVPSTTMEFLGKLDRKSRIVSFRRATRYAAAILLPVFIVLSVWLYEKNSIEKVELSDINAPVVIEPIGNKARLITSTGQSVVLETDKGAIIVDASGVKISNDSLGGLKYQKESLIKSQEEAYNTLITPRGGEYKLELADGTKVWLNCDSELKYPVAFVGKIRKVVLTGEAFFEVARNGKPFIVETADMTMEVLGTRFNVSAYKNEGTVQTTLVNGSLKVGTKNVGSASQSILLVPGKQASFDKEKGILDSREVDVNLYTSWVDGYFRFEGQPLESIMRNISRWYNIDVNFENQQVKEKRLTGKLSRFDDFTVITGMIEKISGTKVKVNGKEIIIMN